ncbi:MAG: 5-formyltetrahydrofolate cyclo-ligase [Sarcina sp.]
MNKKVLRDLMKQKRKMMNYDEKKKFDERIRENVLGSSEYKNSRFIFIYVSMNEEVDTIEIIKIALKQGKTVAVPKVLNKEEMIAVKINSLDDLKARGAFGILEPIDILNVSKEIDLCIMPGLAFTKKGERLGYGGGYYDRFLLKYNNIKKISLAYSYQIVTDIYSCEYDINVDRIITENP